MRLRGFAAALCLIVLVACGGGGGGSSSDAGWKITGTVVDDAGAAVPDAAVTVTLDPSTGSAGDRGGTYTARTDANGGYQLTLPQNTSFPPYFSGVVESPGKIPAPVFFEYENGVVTWDDTTTLSPVQDGDVVLPSTPHITHLGDSNYDGSINSQFQLRYASGTFVTESIVLDAERKARYSQLCVSMHAKGINPWPEAVRTSLALTQQGSADPAIVRALPSTNEDGSYSLLRECFSLSAFAAGTVLDLHVRSGLNGSEYDDFEFISLLATFR